MQHRDDVHRLVREAVDHTIGTDEQFAVTSIPKFRNHTSTLGKLRKTFGGVNDCSRELASRRRGIISDVLDSLL